MKPTGATKEWRVDGFEINDGSRSIVRAPHPDEFPGLTAHQRASVTEASQKNLQLIVTAVNERERLRELLKAAVHAMRSYQHGNSSPDLADEIQLAVNAALNEVEG